MKTVFLPCVMLVTLIACDIGRLTLQAEEPAARPNIGGTIPDFVLPDSTGKLVAWSDFRESRAVVVVFLGTQCPLGNAFVPVLNDLQQRFSAQGVQVIGINSNLSDSQPMIAEHAAKFQVAFPVLVDEQQRVADLFDARRTPEAFLVKDSKICYRGRIDDRFGYNFKRAEPKRRDLEEALQQTLAGEDVAVAETEVEGCLITRKDRLPHRKEITFAKHVSRILQDRCAECHHPGTAAPFSLLTYEDARNWAEPIKETVVERRMPPWNADPRHGSFANDLRMKGEEIDTLLAWIDNGMPLGDPQDLPPPREFAAGWLIDQPDVVLAMPEEYTVPATGTVEYQYFVTPTNFTEDVWVQASEARPGNRAVVHHIIAFVREKGVKGTKNLPMVAGFAPGEEPMVFPAGTGFKVPAGSEIVWQVHYTPTGKVETDRCEVGLVLCKERPPRQVRGGGAFNFSFQIPPGDGNYRVESKAEFSKDVELLSLMPHMHLRGKDFQYTAVYPDGRREVLLSVPKYDFNWQHRYRFAQPPRLPKGTILECVAHFDNSADNPANPDPNKTVRWGDQTWEEMMIGWYSHVDALPQTQQ